ncbi:MAG: AAA family ATPase [Chloroflexi bacterium]|nr:AAA family ATPase [Chloroflexota bacterium]MCL5108218.1 AAA family ATPase [Chloroflexota bacterium]
MGKVIAVANQKGGSGKTTTVRSLSAALAELGRRVLMVDMDPQGSLTEGCGVRPYDLQSSIYHVILGRCRMADVLLEVEPQLHLAPTNIHLAAAELQLVPATRREDKLRQALRPVRDAYDYILIDCPPSFGLLTVNCLSAADSVLIPMTCDYYTMLGVRLLLETVDDIQREVNPSLVLEGLLPTRFDTRTLHAREILEQTKVALGPRLRIFEPVIRESVRFKEAPIRAQSILTYAATSDGANAYRSLAKEIDDGQAHFGA